MGSVRGMSTQTIESRSPQDQSDVVVSAPAADREAVAAAFKRAREAQKEWKRNAVARADALSAAAAALDAAKDQVVDLMVREVGKPLTESVMEHGRAVRILRYQAQSALDPDGDTLPAAPPADLRTLLLARRRPRGVAGLITPWNFPFAIPLWKAAPALAYGNAVVLKPSSDAIASALLIEEILGQHLPEGIFSVVAGGRETAGAVIEQADVISFTGSTGVGMQVAQAATARGIQAQAEMGGLNASIVLPGRRRGGRGEGDRGRGDGLRRPEVHRHRPRDRARRPVPVHGRARRRRRGAAGRRSRRLEHRRRPGDQPAGARGPRQRRQRRARPTAAASSPAARRSTARACSSRPPSSTARTRAPCSRRRRCSARS